MTLGQVFISLKNLFVISMVLSYASSNLARQVRRDVGLKVHKNPLLGYEDTAGKESPHWFQNPNVDVIKNSQGKNLTPLARTLKLNRNPFGGRLNRTRRSTSPQHQMTGTDNVTSLSFDSNSTTVFINFFQSTPSPVLDCKDHWLSCAGRCKVERDLGVTVEESLQCFCDQSCELFQDCCADYDKHCVSSGKTVIKRENPDEPWECVVGGPSSVTRGVWMISSCPTNWTQDEIKRNCDRNIYGLTFDNHKDVLPVFDPDGNAYKNHFCAQCHGLQLTNIKYYDIDFRCEVTLPKEHNTSQLLRLLFSYCSTTNWKTPKGVARRYCYLILTATSCHSSSPLDVTQNCSEGPVGVVFSAVEERNFRNRFCALCKKVTKFQCGPGPEKKQTESGAPKPFSFVMNVGSPDERISEPPQVVQKVISCFEGYVYDFHLKTCRKGVKPATAESPSQQTYSVMVWMQTELVWPRPVVDDMQFRQALVKGLNINETMLSEIDINNPFGPVSTAIFNINDDPTKETNFSIQVLTEAMRSLSLSFQDANFTIVEVAFKLLKCSKIETFNPSDYVFHNNTVKIVSTGEILQEQDFYTNATKEKNGTVTPVGFLFVCKQETKFNCNGVLVSLNPGEYVFSSNGSLYRNISDELYFPGSFLSINRTIWICANFSRNYTIQEIVHTDAKHNDMALVVLTCSGLSLSVLSLTLVLVTFIIFKELRTLPGVNLINLTIALSFSHCLYFATSLERVPVACNIIAVMLHYFFLVSFHWMSIIAFDTWRAMSKIRVRREERFKTRFHVLRCIALGWLPAIGFVGVCVALDRLKAFSFHYGGDKGCWINNRKANLFFFVLPVALSVSFNAVFFSLTVKAIRKTSKQARQVTNQSQHRKDVAVFLKIFILMGFTWLFGFLRLFASSYFDYPFIVFTTLQGVYIAVAFVFTTRVRKMYCALFRQNGTAASRKKNVSSPVVLSKFVKTSERG